MNENLLIAFFVFVARCQKLAWSVSNCWDLKTFEYSGTSWGSVTWGEVKTGLGLVFSWKKPRAQAPKGQPVCSNDPSFGHDS